MAAGGIVSENESGFGSFLLWTPCKDVRNQIKRDLGLGVVARSSKGSLLCSCRRQDNPYSGAVDVHPARGWAKGVLWAKFSDGCLAFVLLSSLLRFASAAHLIKLQRLSHAT